MRTPTSPGALPAREPLPTVQRRERGDALVLDVVVPVFNEETDLGPCVRRLHDHLSRTFPYPFRITIADNASSDRTPEVAAWLDDRLDEVTAVRLEEKGRGRALRTVWSMSPAPVLAYMDVDLSTDLNALLPLVAPLISGHSDLAIGSRLARSSRVVRGTKREFVSRAYNLLLKGSLAARFSDAQCGFKAIRQDVARRLLPMVEDTGWFFDTEMLVLAERAGLRIHEVPVDWVDDPDSRVDIVRTAVEDLKGVWRVGRALGTGALPLARARRPFGDDPRDRELQGVPQGLARQMLGFCAVGALSTLVYLVLYSVLRLGTGAQVANALALLLSAVGNTAANRRFTFGVRGRERAVRHQAQGLLVFGIGLALTSGSLAALHVGGGSPSRGAELSVLIAANLAATVLRFLLLRSWVFPAGRKTVDAEAATSYDRAYGHASMPVYAGFAADGDVSAGAETLAPQVGDPHPNDRYGDGSPYGEGRYGDGRYGDGRYGDGRYGDGDPYVVEPADSAAFNGHGPDGHGSHRDGFHGHGFHGHGFHGHGSQGHGFHGHGFHGHDSRSVR
ncbi:bifunctional glycosyltransferase family 2/GtrA family protein [Streptomyces sp. NPDC051776]|uniref:bifunctional glycosyltransferase family 2/GtrA family protein n=1 Tax=Streptomyces sp. NPDC051776 TaxID=3155414 RepID=UPI00344127DC